MNRGAGWLGTSAVRCPDAWPGGKGLRFWQGDWQRGPCRTPLLTF